MIQELLFIKSAAQSKTSIYCVSMPLFWLSHILLYFTFDLAYVQARVEILYNK